MNFAQPSHCENLHIVDQSRKGDSQQRKRVGGQSQRVIMEAGGKILVCILLEFLGLGGCQLWCDDAFQQLLDTHCNVAGTEEMEKTLCKIPLDKQ